MMVAAVQNEVTCLFTLPTNNLVLTTVGGSQLDHCPRARFGSAGSVDHVAGK